MFGTCLNIAHIQPSSQIYGPGDRFVIWLQGCTLACKGCWNTAMWPHKANQLIEREELIKEIIAERDIAGITLLGGEPLQQTNNLYWLLESLSESSLDVMLYTGYELTELASMPVAQQVLAHVDILVAGRYREELRNPSLLWRGSTNQKIHFLSPKYDRTIIKECNQVEIHIDEFGGLVELGYPEEC
ncbi:4Fe-4S single cluster domain-containing protein [Endozoicomonas euniceicola]|uniref:Anaerobic ribonucleoside-triphosphate reductase-activating protein n=1 Tax=Endozoicomonas euniceicola TaxID=1234143 RepID=A0ABY6GT11_9GAMM|nr:4Fe-4S single cluster domain-containing protein [Endozoicomonas euniceicola]UYM15897.1 radical SAM protein [Endozoicomonas euniceicola]